MRKFLSPAATASAAPVELTSDKLTALKAEYSAAWQKVISCTDPFAPETKDAKLALYKIENEMKAEQAGLQKAANDAKIAEARNQRIALNTAQLDAHTALLAVKADKKAKPEDVTAAENAFNTAKEAVENELLAKFAGSKPAKVTSDGSAKTSGGSSKTDEIFALFDSGKTYDEIISAGYADGTIRSAAWKGHYGKNSDGTYSKKA